LYRTVGEDVDRHAVQGQRDEDATLVRRQDVGDCTLGVARSSLCSASSSGVSPALEKSDHASGSSSTSRPCHARFRGFYGSLEQCELVDPGGELAGAAKVVQAPEDAHQRIVGSLDRDVVELVAS
jgi:hypothetical protein